MEIKNICVVGGGLMGRQIALNAGIYGFNTTVYDINPEVCDDASAWADEYLKGRIAKGRMTEEQVAAVKALFRVEKNLEKALAGVDCVIEAILEVESIKRRFFEQLNALVGNDVIIATNSSYMVSSKFADCVSNPSRLANMHFYNPALVMKFVEIVQGPHTGEETAKALFEFCERTGKTPILMKKELEGFAANYILAGLYERAKWLVENEYCTYTDVDLACENGLGYPMGPFRLNDLTGVDLSYDIMKAEYEKTGVKPLMFDVYKRMVEEGRLGRKTGRGFYDYN